MANEGMKEVLFHYRRAKNFCKPWHENIRRWRALYDFQHYTKRAKVGEERYDDPTYTNVVDLAVGILLSNDMEWKAMSWSPSVPGQRDTSHVEKYLAGTVEVNGEREEAHLIYQAILNFVRDGAAILYSPWDPVLADMYKTTMQIPDPDQGAVDMAGWEETPIRLQVIDPLKIFVLPGGPRRWSWLFRVEQMSVHDVEQTFDVKLNKYSHLTDTMKMEHKGELVDGWNVLLGKKAEVQQKEGIMGGIMEMIGQVDIKQKTTMIVQRVLMYEGIEVWPLKEMEGYDDIPYTLDFFKPVDRDKPKDWGHNIMRPLESSVKTLEKAINRRSRQLAVYSGLPIISKTLPGREVFIDPAVGNHVKLHPDEDLVFPRWPGNPPDVSQHIEFIRGRVQQSGFTDIAFGAGPSQISGYALSQMSDQNRIRLEQPVKHLENLWSRWAKKVLSLTKFFGEGQVVRVFGRMRGQEFIEQVVGNDMDEYRVRAYIKPEFPNERVRNHAMANQVRGVLSESTIMERYLDIDQPDDERRLRIQEMAQTHPVMVQMAVTNALMEMATEGDPAAILTLQQLQEGNLPGQPGRPSEPQANEQMQGVAGPEGEMTRSPEDEQEDLTGGPPQLGLGGP